MTKQKIEDLYKLLRDYFRPIKIKKVYIGESPPKSGKYFYLPKRNFSEKSFGYQIFKREKMKSPSNEQEYFNNLLELKRRGVYITDLFGVPTKIRKKNLTTELLEELFEKEQIKNKPVTFIIPKSRMRNRKFIRERLENYGVVELWEK